MNQDVWTVKTRDGKIVGTIKKLIIDSNSREIAYADLAISESTRVIRVPWSIVAVKKHGILLRATPEEVTAAVCASHSHEPTEPVRLEVTMTAVGKVRQGKVLTRAHPSSAEPTLTPNATPNVR